MRKKKKSKHSHTPISDDKFDLCIKLVLCTQEAERIAVPTSVPGFKPAALPVTRPIPFLSAVSCRWSVCDYTETDGHIEV